MEKDKLRQVIIDQQKESGKEERLIARDIDLDYFLKGNEIVIISGIRRCGKSTLMKLIADQLSGIKAFVNFEDVRLTNFEIKNFQEIEELIVEINGQGKETYYFLDEVQNVKYWERWVNNLYAKGIKVFVTGSNSNLLSSEISSHLTGRNKVIKLFPFFF